MNKLATFFKGVFMGVADIIPGVSGGTIALITGIYDKLLESIVSIKPLFLVDFLKGDFRKGWAHVKSIDFSFLIPLALGIGLAIVLMSKLITYMLTHHTALSFAFFFGLILASAAQLYVHPFKTKEIPFFILGIIISILLVNSGILSIGHSLPVVFASGIIGIIAMILPGISGSFILLLLGQYEHMLIAIRDLDWITMLVFIAGAVLGLMGFSRVLQYILKRWRNYTMCFLIGLMLGALWLPGRNILASMVALWQVVLAGCLGFLAVVSLRVKNHL